MVSTLTAWISEFMEENARKSGFRTSWEEPLVAAAAAEDPLFLKMREMIAPDYLLPTDLLPEARSVVVYFLPFTPEINLSNIVDRESSPDWALAYIETNKMIEDINEHLTARLNEHNYKTAVIPPTHNFDPVQLKSCWSHKHAAYVAGLGTFGLNHLLITTKGSNGRIGSFVTNLELEPTPRPGFEYCLAKFNGSCGLCIRRCPQELLGYDKPFERQKCYELLLVNAAIYRDLGLADVCGKCSCQLPCSFMAPSAILVSGKGV